MFNKKRERETEKLEVSLAIIMFPFNSKILSFCAFIVLSPMLLCIVLLTSHLDHEAITSQPFSAHLDWLLSSHPVPSAAPSFRKHIFIMPVLNFNHAKTSAWSLPWLPTAGVIRSNLISYTGFRTLPCGHYQFFSPLPLISLPHELPKPNQNEWLKLPWVRHARLHALLI